MDNSSCYNNWSSLYEAFGNVFKSEIQEPPDVVAAAMSSFEEFKNSDATKVRPPNDRMVQRTIWVPPPRRFLKAKFRCSC